MVAINKCCDALRILKAKLDDSRIEMSAISRLSMSGRKSNYVVSARSAGSGLTKKKLTNRIVPPFSIESLQKNTRVQEPQSLVKGKIRFFVLYYH